MKENTTMKNTNEYIINHAAKAITITKSFEKRSSVIGSEEFRKLSQLHTAFPDYAIQRRTAIVSDQKEIHKGLTVDRMEEYIKKITNGDEKALNAFDEVKKFYKNQSSYYPKVKAWFLANYKEEYKKLDPAA